MTTPGRLPRQLTSLCLALSIPLIANACGRTEWYPMDPVGYATGGTTVKGTGGALDGGTGGVKVPTGGGTARTGGTTLVTGGTTPRTGGFILGGATGVGGAGGSFNTTYNPACPCSRRTGENNSAKWCPEGSDRSVASVFDRNGGVLTLATTPSTQSVPATITIPPNALREPSNVGLTENHTAPPLGYVDYSPIYVFEVSPGPLLAPVKLSLPALNNQYSIPAQLAIYWSADGGSYSKLPDSYINAGFLQASLPRTGFVFTGYPQAATCP